MLRFLYQPILRRFARKTHRTGNDSKRLGFRLSITQLEDRTAPATLLSTVAGGVYVEHLTQEIPGGLTLYLGDGSLSAVGGVGVAGENFTAWLADFYPPNGLVYMDGVNKNKGMVEFDLSSLSIAENSTVTFNFTAGGFKAYDDPDLNPIPDPTPNLLNVYVYSGDGDVTTSDYNGAATQISQITTPPRDQESFQIDVTTVIQSFLANGNRYLGFRFEAGSASTYDGIGNPTLTYEPLPDLAVQSATLQSGNTVQFIYETTGNPGPFEVGLYRSTDGITYNPADLVAMQTVTPSPTNPQAPGTFTLPNELPIDPSHPYILVVADPNARIAERYEANNVDEYRKWVIGVVVHGGNMFTTTIPSWATDMAFSLRGQNYDLAYPFDWSSEVRQWRRGMTTVAATRLASDIVDLAQALPVELGDVVDLHMIGHSRGAVVVSEALDRLRTLAGSIPLIDNGFIKMTMLDPHPARNTGSLSDGIRELVRNTGVSNTGSFSYTPVRGLFSGIRFSINVETLRFQERTDDPLAYVPPNVDQPELYYQRSLWSELPLLSPERFLNLWGQSPNTIINYSSAPLDITFLPGVSHTGVRELYQAFVVPTLSTGGN
jgi:hypothetical protein